MPTKQDYKQIIQRKLSADTDEKSKEKASVDGTDQHDGSNTHVPTKEEYH